ncbi:MAG: 2-amino-4-hydroxy-6-hydroxymethyldihydropteridine diphosphokinase [Pseudomonadota bacterium]
MNNSSQPDFHNTIATGVTELSANTLLRHAKAVEKAAGRNPGVRFGPRPIDIDLIDYGGRIVRWPPVSRAWRQLTLPHPRAHLRSFVLIPLIQIQPEWRHPVFGVSPEALLKRLPIRDQRL